MSLKLNVLEKKAKAAKHMYFGGIPNKTIAQLVNVTEKTVSLWCKKYGWKADRKKELNNEIGSQSSMKVYPIYWEFSHYLQDKNPELLTVIELEILNYLKS